MELINISLKQFIEYYIKCSRKQPLGCLWGYDQSDPSKKTIIRIVPYLGNGANYIPFSEFDNSNFREYLDCKVKDYHDINFDNRIDIILDINVIQKQEIKEIHDKNKKMIGEEIYDNTHSSI